MLIVSCTRASEKKASPQNDCSGWLKHNYPLNKAYLRFLGLLGRDRHYLPIQGLFRQEKPNKGGTIFSGMKKEQIISTKPLLFTKVYEISLFCIIGHLPQIPYQKSFYPLLWTFSMNCCEPPYHCKYDSTNSIFCF